MAQEHPKEEKLRMDPKHKFRFNCCPGISCFTQCCQDINIALTPYDVLRLRRALGISSGEFIEKYTITIPQKKSMIPLVILRMNETDKRCPLVTQDGCIVYQDRPWSCRMYPLDMNRDGTFSMIPDTSWCQGLKENDVWRISDWLVDQGIVPYDEMNKLFSSMTVQLLAQKLAIDNPDISKMTFMALYNLDKFREFVFKSTFLDRFDIDAKRVKEIKKHDEELLKLGIDWIKFGLFGQKLFKVKQKPS